MSRLQVSDYALLRFLERVGGMDVEGVREQIAGSLQRAHDAARSLGGGDHLIVADGHSYVVRGTTVTTVVRTGSAASRAATLASERQR